MGARVVPARWRRQNLRMPLGSFRRLYHLGHVSAWVKYLRVLPHHAVKIREGRMIRTQKVRLAIAPSRVEWTKKVRATPSGERSGGFEYVADGDEGKVKAVCGCKFLNSQVRVISSLTALRHSLRTRCNLYNRHDKGPPSSETRIWDPDD